MSGQLEQVFFFVKIIADEQTGRRPRALHRGSYLGRLVELRDEVARPVTRSLAKSFERLRFKRGRFSGRLEKLAQLRATSDLRAGGSLRTSPCKQRSDCRVLLKGTEQGSEVVSIDDDCDRLAVDSDSVPLGLRQLDLAQRRIRQ